MIENKDIDEIIAVVKDGMALKHRLTWQLAQKSNQFTWW